VWTAGRREYQNRFIWKTHPSNTVENEVISYSNWLEGEPNDEGDGEDCLELWYFGEMYATGDAGKWNDGRCTTESCFLCEV